MTVIKCGRGAARCAHNSNLSFLLFAFAQRQAQFSTRTSKNKSAQFNGIPLKLLRKVDYTSTGPKIISTQCEGILLQVLKN